MLAIHPDVKPRKAVIFDMAWALLEAAYDLADTFAFEASRRVIDAHLRGLAAVSADVDVVPDYFG